MLNKLEIIKKGKSTSVLLNGIEIPMIKKMAIVEEPETCELILHISIDRNYKVLNV